MVSILIVFGFYLEERERLKGGGWSIRCSNFFAAIEKLKTTKNGFNKVGESSVTNKNANIFQIEIRVYRMIYVFKNQLLSMN